MKQFDPSLILSKKYEILKYLSKGGFGKAYLAKNKDTNEQLVIKEINLRQLSDNANLLVSKEGLILSKLNHKNIIKFFEFYHNKDTAYLMMEYAECGDLYSKIEEQKKVKKVYFKEHLILNWFIEICEGVKCIHENKIIHRDLKPKNLFLTKNNSIKIGDFGIAKIIGNDLTKSHVGTVSYYSPEIVKGEKYNYKSDIWDLGIILYELTQLQHPFMCNNIEKICNDISEGKIQALRNDKYSKELIDLIFKLLKTNPDDRLNIIQLVDELYRIKNLKYNDQKNM